MAEGSSDGNDANQQEAATGEAAAGADATQEAPPQIVVMSQYVKDLSFENPRAPNNFDPEQEPPQVNVNVNVNASDMGGDNYEVSLRIDASAKQGADTVFLVEVEYGGVFSLAGIEGEPRQMLLLIECPRLLFPFARNVVAEVTRDGGFPPLLIQPIDFVALYQRQQAEAQAAGTA